MELLYALLHKIPFFQNLPFETLKSLVDSGSVVNYEANHSLFREGDPGDALYLILTGEVSIVARNDQGQEIPLATLQAGEFFGELALAEGGVRTASAITLEPCQLFALNRSAFFNQMAASPELLSQVISAISQKIRSVNQHLFQEQLQKQVLQLEIGKVQRKTIARMVQGLSKEVALPLHTAQTQLENLLIGLPEHKQTEVQEIQLQLGRALMLVQSLQAIAPGEVHSHRQAVDWSAFWSRLQELYRVSSLRRLPLDIHISAEASDQVWQGYPAQLAEVLMHLLNNCEVHAYPLSEDPVHLLLDFEENNFVLRVQDQGLGIAPDVCAQIRTPFFSTRKEEGHNGMGLAVVDNLVSSVLNGEMTIDSEAGAGTTVTLRFPPESPLQS
jgi:CRP-like cAMP-binding protein/anti-sigma regulatory factor (Ser/Thr protein kinase)